MEKDKKVNRGEIFELHKKYFEVEKEQNDKSYLFLKNIITTSTGILAAIIIFTNSDTDNYLNELLRIITISLLGLCILFCSIALYGEIDVLNRLRLSLGEYTNRLSVGKDADKNFLQSKKKTFYKVVEYVSFSFYGIFIISLIGFGITLNNGKKEKSIEEKLLLELKSERNELNDNYQKQLNHKNTLILELKHEIDSLKTLQLKIK